MADKLKYILSDDTIRGWNIWTLILMNQSKLDKSPQSFKPTNKQMLL